MGRHSPSSTWIEPKKSDGTVPPAGADTTLNANNSLGMFTLTAGTTYYYFLGGKDACRQSAHFHWDSAIIITSMSLETCDFPGNMVDSYDSSAGGRWIPEVPTVRVVGAGVTGVAGVVAAAGGAEGGARFNFVDNGSRRTRVVLVVGATGGEMRASEWAKE